MKRLLYFDWEQSDSLWFRQNKPRSGLSRDRRSGVGFGYPPIVTATTDTRHMVITRAITTTIMVVIRIPNVLLHWAAEPHQRASNSQAS